MITGNCLIIAKKPIEQIMAETPRGCVPMFDVVSSTDEHDMVPVYINAGKVYNCMTNEIVNSVKTAEQLRFSRYINF